MNFGQIAVWIAQVILAAFFIVFGIGTQAGALICQLPPEFVPFMGLAEVCFAVALMVPAFSRALLILTPIALVGLFSTMAYPLSGGGVALLNVLGLLAFVVVWGRYKSVQSATSRPATGEAD